MGTTAKKIEQILAFEEIERASLIHKEGEVTAHKPHSAFKFYWTLTLKIHGSTAVVTSETGCKYQDDAAHAMWQWVTGILRVSAKPEEDT